MSDDLLPPPAPPPPAPPEPPPPAPSGRQTRTIECEFCGCRLFPTGEVMARGDQAKRFANLDIKLETLEAENERLTHDVEAARSELSALKAAATTKKPLFPI